MTDCRDARESIGAYVLGGLEPDDAEALVEHLRTCSMCAEVYGRQARLLPVIELAGPPEAAPSLLPELEQRIMARIAAEHALPGPLWRHRRPRWALPAVAGALAGAVATLVIVAGLGAFGSNQGKPARTIQTIELAGTRYAPNARATARVLRQLNTTTIDLEATNLPPSLPGEHYEVWLNSRQGAFNAGTFRVGRDGWAQAALTSAAQLGPQSTIDVSIEPNRGSPNAPPLVVLRATLPA